MNTLKVRVAPKSGLEQFYRCGTKFTKEWVDVSVDKATADRLDAEQMLEVQTVTPEAEEPNGGESAPVKKGK